MSALTVCSAYFGQLGGLKEMEQAIQQADELLKYYTNHSPQAKRYGLILKKLSKAAIDCLKAMEDRERLMRNIVMPQLFKLNAPGSELSRSGNAGFTDPNWTTSSEVEHTWSSAEEPSTYPIDSTSLLDLVHFIKDVNDPSCEGNSMSGDLPNEYLFNLESTEDLWNLNWSGSLL